jgi:hypothetical protein
MKRLLLTRVTSPNFDLPFAWLASFVLAILCTTATLKMLPVLPFATSVALVGGLACAWIVLGWQLPRMVPARPVNGL